MTFLYLSIFFISLFYQSYAGDKPGTRPQTVPDIHLPGQTAFFSKRTAFNPFTHAVSAVYTEDITDSWGAGFAVNGVNNYNLKIRQNFDEYASAPLITNDGGHQPLISAFTVGGEYDLSKIREVAGHVDIPVIGINELFDFDGRLMGKTFGNGVLNSHIDFPLSLSDPRERFPASFNYLNFMADRHMHYGHVVPNVSFAK
uniref:Uncharacterized protein n=1 Tax=Panagrolaimus sp. ES5 TaxID=591445 RepID=A0AC34F4I0_9BILA